MRLHSARFYTKGETAEKTTSGGEKSQEGGSRRGCHYPPRQSGSQKKRIEQIEA